MGIWDKKIRPLFRTTAHAGGWQDARASDAGTHAMARTFLQCLWVTIAVAAIYYLTGKLGLKAAIASGNATVIWPPSGIMVALCIIYGPVIWPGVFAGAFLLSPALAHILGGTEHAFAAVLACAAAGLGAAAQAALIAWRARRGFGMPLHIESIKQLAAFFCVVTPLGCLTSATISVCALAAQGYVNAADVTHTWFSWWLGDVLGIALFLPILLLAHQRIPSARTRQRRIAALPSMAMLLLLMPAALTFYAWKISAQYVDDKSRTTFNALAMESEKAFFYRLEDYRRILLGTAGFVRDSRYVSRDEWHGYIHSLELQALSHGIAGMGYFEPTAAEGAFDIDAPDHMASYYEPVTDLEGLKNDLKSGAARLAAETARQKSETIMTPLENKRGAPARYLVFKPVYYIDVTPNATDITFRGWVYCVIDINPLASDLTLSQGDTIDIAIYDEKTINGRHLIYSSAGMSDADKPSLRYAKSLRLFQRHWIIQWQGTRKLEALADEREPLLVLLGGVIFCGVLAVFLFTLAQRNRFINREVENKSREIIAANERMRMLVRYTPAAVAMFDPHMRYITASDHWIAAFGMKGRAYEGFYHTQVVPASRISPDLAAACRNCLRGEVVRAESDLWTTGDHHDEWVKYDMRPWYDRDGLIGGVVMFTEFVTAKKEAEEKLRAAYLSAEQERARAEAATAQAVNANRLKSEFLANMSHEIRTPLHGIISALTLLRQSGINEKQNRYLSLLERLSGNLLQLINDILDISRIEAGEVRVQPEIFHLQDEIDNLCATFLPAAQEKGIAIETVYDTSIPAALLCDPLRLRQIVANLLSNALKFTEYGSILLRFRLHRSAQGGTFLYGAVTDTGPGVPDAFQPFIFDKFSQADASTTRRHGGTGLGLAITRQLARIQGGDITLDSMPGHGATFTFYFQVAIPGTSATAPADHAYALKSPLPAAPPNRAVYNLDILLAEDDPISAMLMQEILASMGCTVTTAAHGAEALKHMLRKTFDLVLMDGMMPRMDGFETTRRMRDHEKKKALPPMFIVAMTASALESDKQKCLDAGMDDYMPKPATEAMIRRILDAAAALQSSAAKITS